LSRTRNRLISKTSRVTVRKLLQRMA
jgi:hypothetical protein